MTLTCVFVCTMAPRVIADSFTVDSWLLLVGIDGESSIRTGSATVSNPFVTTHSRMLGNDWVSADYDFSWAEQGRFLVDASLAATATPTESTTTGVSGRIKITPTDDLVVRYRTVFDVTLPADFMIADLSFDVFDAVTHEEIHDVSASADTIFHTGDSHLADEGEFLLPANRTWDFAYLFRIINFPSAAGAQGVGNGFLEFEIIPEPATILLCAPIALLLLRRTREAQTRFRR
ncbi:MAG: hypothetical protein H6818_24110 [Phycisphaerales bacterium]|nr:hypothetical protein [Phycisphaerales bacterium]MCB9858776.1 hypothetical protein [Phycisphaerales bacterium]